MEFYTKFKDVEKVKPTSMRGHVRNLVLSGLYLKNRLTGFEQDLSKPRIQFLYFHHLFQDEERQLEVLLERLSKTHSFLSYSQAVDKILNREIDKPYIVFSSDDGFKNNIKAAEILKSYGISACYFVNPGIVGETDFNTITAHCKNRLNFPPVEFMTWDDINMLQAQGHEIGSHTMQHINVAQTSDEDFRVDAQKTYDILKEKCGEVKHFAYPYGRFDDFTDTARKTVFETGYSSCATAARGCHVNHNQPLKKEDLFIRRDHLVLGWDLNHTIWFMANNARNANTSNNIAPY